MSDRDDLAEIIHETNWASRAEWRFSRATPDEKKIAYARADRVLSHWVPFDREKTRAEAHALLATIPSRVEEEFSAKKCAPRVRAFLSSLISDLLDDKAAAKYRAHVRVETIDQMADALEKNPSLSAVDWLREQSRLTVAHQVSVAQVPVRS